TLESFVNSIVDENYEFEAPLSNREISLGYENFFIPSFNDPEEVYFDPVVTFFTQAADNDYFFDKASFKLTFKDGIELNDLSDGEFQILFLYALVDLFDSEDSLFLLDEVDSHLHYKNIENLWDALHSIQGHALTTTHLLDSITAPQNGFEHLKIVDRGIIKEDRKAETIINRLSSLSRMRSVQFDVCSKLENIVLMDDYNDWTIFLALAQRKGLNIALLSNLQVIKQESSCGGPNEKLGKAKFEWIKSLLSSEAEKRVKNIFIICDKDEAAIEFKINDGVSVAGQESRDSVNSLRAGNGGIGMFFLAWKRREIKTYLLSYTALSNNGLIDHVNNDEIPARSYLKENDSADNDAIRALDVKNYITTMIDTDGVGLDKSKLEAYVSEIPISEISEDISNMYNFMVGKL
ncbi:AAA family ATPase, partial [Psychromonas sp. Urea-02u-13]|uniref:AAA family ATPase n=1 Tax=Psychromonas sp. Urea-02u-13 TaxID=2058326 RepID=UPI000C32EA20